MHLEIPKDVEASIQSRAAAVGFKSVEEYILELLELDEEAARTPQPSREQWLQKFDAWVNRQTSHNPHFDGSRESMYPVR